MKCLVCCNDNTKLFKEKGSNIVFCGRPCQITFHHVLVQGNDTMDPLIIEPLKRRLLIGNNGQNKGTKRENREGEQPEEAYTGLDQWSRIPRDVLLYILYDMDIQSLLRFCSTSTRISQFCRDENFRKEYLFRNGMSTILQILRNFFNDKTNELYSFHPPFFFDSDWTENVDILQHYRQNPALGGLTPWLVSAAEAFQSQRPDDSQGKIRDFLGPYNPDKISLSTSNPFILQWIAWYNDETSLEKLGVTIKDYTEDMMLAAAFGGHYHVVEQWYIVNRRRTIVEKHLGPLLRAGTFTNDNRFFQFIRRYAQNKLAKKLPAVIDKLIDHSSDQNFAIRLVSEFRDIALVRPSWKLYILLGLGNTSLNFVNGIQNMDSLVQGFSPYVTPRMALTLAENRWIPFNMATIIGLAIVNNMENRVPTSSQKLSHDSIYLLTVMAMQRSKFDFVKRLMIEFLQSRVDFYRLIGRLQILQETYLKNLLLIMFPSMNDIYHLLQGAIETNHVDRAKIIIEFMQKRRILMREGLYRGLESNFRETGQWGLIEPLLRTVVRFDQ